MEQSFNFPEDPVLPHLEEKVIIVAGGGSGIGKTTAVYLGDAGANVVVNDVSENSEIIETIQDRGGRVLGHYGDVSSLEYTETLIRDTVNEFGRVDGIINFAGILRDTFLVNMSGKEWDEVIRVHLRGHFSLLRNAARHWREQVNTGDFDSQRSFVTVTSRQAFGAPGQLNYSSAKAGILGLTWTAAAELNRFNIRVNSLMPLAFTDMIAEIPEEKRPSQWTPEQMPPEKIAPVAAYLLSDEAEDITGCIVRSHADMIGLVSEPNIEPKAFRDDGWTFESLTERFRDVLGDETSLERT